MNTEPREPQPLAPNASASLTDQDAQHLPFDATGDQRFRAVVQNATDLVAINDRHGIVRYISPSVTRILGYAPDELVGRPSFELVHPDDLRRVAEGFAARVERGEPPAPVRMRFRHRSGEWRTLEALSTNMLDHPAIQGVVVNARDISDRVEQERRLSLQASILSQINDAVVGLSPDDRVSYWNSGAAQLFGVSADDALCRPLAELCTYDILPPESAASALAALEASGRWRGEAAIAQRHGRQIIGELAVSQLRDEEGAASGILVVIRDISERKRVEDRLRLMEAVVVNANDAVLVTDAAPLDPPGPRICYVNEAFTQLTGYPAEEVIGRDPRFLQGPETSRADLDRLRDAIGRHEPVRVELVNYTADGRPHWIELSIAAVHDERGAPRYFLSIQRDIDARKAAERLEHDRRAILEQIVADGPLPTILARVAAMVEAQAAGRCVVLISGPRPAAYPAAAATPSLAGALAALAAASHAEPLLIADAQADERCAPWRGLLAGHGARAIVAQPIALSGAQALVVWYANAPLAEAARLRDLIDSAARIGALAMERNQLSELLRFQAFHDQLTGLTNRYDFHTRLAQALEAAQRRTARVGLLFIDLDNFKHVNDTLGHPSGDALLVQVARRLGACLGPDAHPARWGGDEFLVLTTAVGHPSDAEALAQAVLEGLSAPFELEGREIALTVSIGVAVFPEDGADPTTLLKHADTALYRAKAGGRNAVRRFSPDMSDLARQFIDLEPALRRAVAGGGLEAYYQPVVDIRRGRVTAVEALVRWPHPSRGLLLPGAFLPLAEASGMGDALRTHIFEVACRDAARWRAAGLPDLRISVNVAAPQLADEGFAAKVTQTLERYGLPASAIELEITESAILHDLERTAVILANLRDTGVHIALDDFGTGYSSLSYLGRLPLDTLKVDRSFVQSLAASRSDTTWPSALVEAIVTLARRLNLAVVAEGVETAGQLEAVRRLGCDLVQGWHFARAVPLSDLPATIAAIEARL